MTQPFLDQVLSIEVRSYVSFVTTRTKTMKISKDLLKQIAIGVCFAGAITACGIHDEDPLSDEQEICEESQATNQGDVRNLWDDCVDCGMG